MKTWYVVEKKPADPTIFRQNFHCRKYLVNAISNKLILWSCLDNSGVMSKSDISPNIKTLALGVIYTLGAHFLTVLQKYYL